MYRKKREKRREIGRKREKIVWGEGKQGKESGACAVSPRYLDSAVYRRIERGGERGGERGRRDYCIKDKRWLVYTYQCESLCADCAE